MLRLKDNRPTIKVKHEKRKMQRKLTQEGIQRANKIRSSYVWKREKLFLEKKDKKFHFSMVKLWGKLRNYFLCVLVLAQETWEHF